MKKYILISLIFVLLFLSAFTPKASWDFNSNYFKIEISNKGYITSMENITLVPQAEAIILQRIKDINYKK